MRKHDNWLKGYMSYTRNSESPDNFHFWTGVATIAGALRRRVWIEQNQFQWTPNFYIVLVGPPGVAAKSTSIRQGLNLLERANIGVHFGPQSMTWQALTVSLEQSTEGVEIGDEVHPMSCLTISVSELGTFLDAKNDELMSTLIAMWDGQLETWRRSTKTQGDTVVVNPWLNVIGCTTPAWIKAQVPASMIGGGLTSRIIFIYGDTKRHYIAYPARSLNNTIYKKEAEELIHDLQEIANIKGQYIIDEDAMDWGEAYYKDLYENRPSHMASERFDGYISRKQTHLHKIAMVVAAAKRNDLVITIEDLKESANFLRLIEEDMLKVFASIGVTAGAMMAQEVLALIRNAKVIEYQQLFQLVHKTIPMRDFLDAMKGLLQAGYIQTTVKQGQKYIVFVDVDATSQSVAQSRPDPQRGKSGRSAS